MNSRLHPYEYYMDYCYGTNDTAAAIVAWQHKNFFPTQNSLSMSLTLSLSCSVFLTLSAAHIAYKHIEQSSPELSAHNKNKQSAQWNFILSGEHFCVHKYCISGIKFSLPLSEMHVLLNLYLVWARTKDHVCVCVYDVTHRWGFSTRKKQKTSKFDACVLSPSLSLSSIWKNWLH